MLEMVLHLTIKLKFLVTWSRVTHWWLPQLMKLSKAPNYIRSLKNKINTKEHWDKIYATKKENEVSWFQPYPKTSIEFLGQFKLPLTANIIDIGGGNSHFVDVLLEKGYQNIWMLDISNNAIDVAKDRLGKKAKKIHWLVSDVTEFDFTDLEFDLWHDRAAFHFLITEDKIDKY